MTKRRCVTCGGPITSHGRDTKQCASCWTAARMFCLECGRELDKRNQRPRLCRACWLTAHPPRFCATCGVQLVNTRITTVQCTRCRIIPHPLCEMCGKDLPQSSTGKRCWDCWSSLRQSRPKKTCQVVGCLSPHKARGFCSPHYQNIWRRGRNAATSAESDSSAYVYFKTQPCRLCAYDRLPPDIHRVIPGANGGRYVLGNMVPLCARCHAEVHRGITPCPEPITEIPISA